MSSAEQAIAELKEEFGFFDNWMDRYQYIMDLGKALPEFPDQWKTAEYRIEGCQSNVWFHHEYRDNKLHFEASSDAAIVTGLVAIVLRIYNDRAPGDILQTPADALKALGLEQHLSPTRNNGLHAMLGYIYRLAGQYAE